MKPINFGKTDEGEDVNVDFDEAGIRFILLAGMTGSGKSVFATHLYRELMDAYTPAELGFVVLDMTRVSFSDWGPAYLARLVITDPDEALAVLETLKDEERKIFVHIEECDMVYRDRARFEKAIERIRHENKNITIVYSTSRIDPDYLADWLEKYIDMKVVFRVASPVDSQFLLGSDAAFLLREPGERIVAYGDRLIPCRPFSEA
jgi:DNA segregation ATPase FtsK/SpoIIIE-like protein